MNETRTKVLITSPPLDRLGGITNYIHILIKYLGSNKIQFSHFAIGMSVKNYGSGFTYHLSPTSST